MRLFCDSEAVVFSRTGVHGICVRVIMGDIIDCDRSVQSNKLLYIITHLNDRIKSSISSTILHASFLISEAIIAWNSQV